MCHGGLQLQYSTEVCTFAREWGCASRGGALVNAGAATTPKLKFTIKERREKTWNGLARNSKRFV
jgi:hypothetical protein